MFKNYASALTNMLLMILNDTFIYITRKRDIDTNLSGLGKLNSAL